VISFIAAGGCLVAWLKDGARQRGSLSWLLLGGGLGAAGLAEALMWVSLENSSAFLVLISLVLRAVGPWLMAAAGLDFFFRLRDEDTGRPMVDAVLSAGSLALPGWYFVVLKVWLSPGPWDVSRALAAIQPIGLAACLAGAVAIAQCIYRRGVLRQGPAWMAGGLALIAVLGSFASYSSAQGHPGPSTGLEWMDAALALGGLAIALAAGATLKSGSEEWEATSDEEAGLEPTPFRMGRSVLPFALASGSFFLTSIHEITTKGGVSVGVVIFGFVLSALGIVRQVQHLSRSQKMLRDNELLTDKIRLVSESLEQTVVQRTHQLKALHQVTKAVNNTLEPEKVLSLASLHTKTALECDAVVIWNLEKDGKGVAVLRGAIQIGLNDQPHVGALIYQMAPASEVEQYPIPSDPSAPDAQVGTLLRAPLFAQQKLIGMIGAIRLRGSFHKSDWEMLESIGLETGIALHHATLYSRAIELADVDPVTSLFNHRAINQRLESLTEEAVAAGGEMAVMMMDMNNFKMFNDTYGHPAGDEALRRVGRALAEACHGRGYVGRYGGDEFLAVLPGLSSEGAAELARGVQALLLSQGFMPNPQDGRVIPLGLSFGIASFPDDSKNRHDLLAIADSNLYSAKRSQEGIRLTSEVERANRELKSEHSFAVLDGMVTAVDNKDSYTRRHSEDVAEFALWIAEELGVSPEGMRTIRVGALLHDVGKITVPDEILRKPGRLTPEEFEVLKRHPRLGALIVGGVPGMESILDIVQSHHERWDGKGYPDELEGQEIPLLGRLVAVADTFSAMTTDRPYRKGRDWQSALREIEAMSGSQFDPQMAEAFLRAVQKRVQDGSIYRRFRQEAPVEALSRAA
jgi:diguanylate cyclase (GGDEF)-like protein/putative nucleotidyltransferase with HDIG domain